MIWELGRVIGAAFIGALAAYNLGWFAGERQGYDRRMAEVAIEDGKAEMERKGDDARIQDMSDYDLCVLGLSGGNVSIAPCEQLRGVRAK